MEEGAKLKQESIATNKLLSYNSMISKQVAPAACTHALFSCLQPRKMQNFAMFATRHKEKQVCRQSDRQNICQSSC